MEGEAAWFAWWRRHSCLRGLTGAGGTADRIFLPIGAARLLYNGHMESTIRLMPHSREFLEAQLAREPMRSPEEVIERALETLLGGESHEDSHVPSGRAVADAVAGIFSLQQRNKLGGREIRDLFHEGHKF